MAPYRPCPVQLRPPTLADHLLALPLRRFAFLVTLLAVLAPLAADHLRQLRCSATDWTFCRIGR